MIRSFRCAETERLFADRPSKKFRSISRPARRKLEMIHAAQKLDDLRNPPGNHFWRSSEVIGLVSIAFALTISFGFVFAGLADMLKTLR